MTLEDTFLSTIRCHTAFHQAIVTDAGCPLIFIETHGTHCNYGLSTSSNAVIVVMMALAIVVAAVARTVTMGRSAKLP